MATSAKMVKVVRVAVARLNNLSTALEDEKMSKDEFVLHVKEQVKNLQEITEEK